ncbi:hypothetical protein RCL1_001937 [Eukaryota sp. TZLM3-RCL]
MNGKQLFLNIIWAILIGWAFFVEYMVAAFFLALTIIGIPFAYQIARAAFVALVPFGTRIGPVSETASVLGTIFNIVWVVLFGWWMALLHVILAIIFFILIITIPFGIASWRLAKFIIWPFNREIEWVENDSWT